MSTAQILLPWLGFGCGALGFVLMGLLLDGWR